MTTCNGPESRTLYVQIHSGEITFPFCILLTVIAYRLSWYYLRNIANPNADVRNDGTGIPAAEKNVRFDFLYRYFILM